MNRRTGSLPVTSVLPSETDVARDHRHVRKVLAVLGERAAVHFLSPGITGSISRDDELMMFRQLVPTLA
jgi:hypothetical protein